MKSAIFRNYFSARERRSVSVCKRKGAEEGHEGMKDAHIPHNLMPLVGGDKLGDLPGLCHAPSFREPRHADLLAH